MPTYESAPGREHGWNLLKKLGEGDAGEVFLVESFIDKQVGILKRPRRSSFTSEIIRQASQIEREGIFLNALASASQPSSRLLIPTLLDTARSGAEFSERYFIVITKATGFDLNFLARVARGEVSDKQRNENSQVNPLPTELYSDLDGTLRTYLKCVGESLSQQKQTHKPDDIITHYNLPSLILLRSFSYSLDFLEFIHKVQISDSSMQHGGIIWNDVKPDHFFWDPIQARLTLIDWGNAQFLNSNGISDDRQYSRADDYLQFISAMGNFLNNHSPYLHTKLEWPSRDDFDARKEDIESYLIKPLKERISQELGEVMAELRKTRQTEAKLTNSTSTTSDHYSQLTSVHNKIIELGELPDYDASIKLYERLAILSVENNHWNTFHELCSQAYQIPGLNPEHWNILGKLAHYAEDHQSIQNSLRYAIKNDWLNMLWEFCKIPINTLPPELWDKTCRYIRSTYLGIAEDAPTPFIAVNRLVHILQEITLRGNSNGNPQTDDDSLELLEQVVRQLRQEILPRWQQIEPDPPDSGLGYDEVLRSLNAIDQSHSTPGMSSSLQSVFRSLEQPKAQVDITLGAWNRREFDLARNGLKNILIWDPHLTRLFLADQAIISASTWLETLRRGPSKDETRIDFTTRLEIEGRNFRNQVGPALWLDDYLKALSKLRRGVDPADILIEDTSLRNDFVWLLEKSNSPILELPDRPLRLDRYANLPQPEIALRGVHEGTLGLDKDISLADPLDAWTPEARGSSARVFLGYLKTQNTQSFSTCAFKIMRSDSIDYALPLFREEVQVLSQLRGIPGVIPLLEFGFIKLKDNHILPPENFRGSASELAGKVLRFGQDSIHNFLQELPSKVHSDWLPYLATTNLDQSDNLLLLCDASYTQGRLMPVLEGLRVSIQICEILEAAHSRNVIYRDHKILHYYWQPSLNGVYTIDWNIAKTYPEGISISDIQFDLVQFAARTLHHIFTGRSAPGALPLGPTRPDEIEAAARSYSAQWKYDDQRMPKDLKEIVEKSLSGQYTQARLLKEDLMHLFQTLCELIPKETN
jgi:serine/threonine protein kinase